MEELSRLSGGVGDREVNIFLKSQIEKFLKNIIANHIGIFSLSGKIRKKTSQGRFQVSVSQVRHR